MTGRINATPAGRRVEVTIVAVLDPSEPTIGAGPTVYADLLDRPVLAVADLDATDPSRVGEVVIGLLRAQLIPDD